MLFEKSGAYKRFDFSSVITKTFSNLLGDGWGVANDINDNQ